jgi:short-chain fatty acids transporter
MTSPPDPSAPQRDWLSDIAKAFGALIPDAVTTSIALLIVVFAAALWLGNTLEMVADAYYRGLWMLLAFTMQMTLILVLSSALGAAPFFRRAIILLSNLPKTETAVLAMCIIFGAAMSYMYWGLGLAVNPLIAVFFARAAEKKGLRMDFPFLLSTTVASGSVWQYGFSASAPLLMNTPGHFLEEITGIMPLSTTIFAPATAVFVVGFLVLIFVAARLLLPKKPRFISRFTRACQLADEAQTAPKKPATAADPPLSGTLSERLEASPVPTALLALALAGWLYYHFAVKGLGLQLNALNTTLLFLCLVFHRTIWNFSKALPGAVVTAWPVIVLYHLYAGVAGVIQFTTVGEEFVSMFAAYATPLTFPLLTALAGTLMAIFVPSSGGQWVIQGFITAKTALTIGVTAQRGLLALGVGDHMGNLLSPFWAVIAGGIARIDYRQYIGYNLVFAAIWFTYGVICFTFLPA